MIGGKFGVPRLHGSDLQPMAGRNSKRTPIFVKGSPTGYHQNFRERQRLVSLI
jgi:hypothetical protein